MWTAALAVWAVWSVLSSLAWIVSMGVVLRTLRAIPRLRDDASPAPPCWPRVSLIVPARDEARDLERAVRTRLADAYPDLQLIVVDDRSTDGTGAIADALASADPRVRVIHVTELPAGWLGKLHALARGVSIADGEWLLFSDADVEFSPGTLCRVIAFAEHRQLDHVTVVPGFRSNGFPIDAAIHAFARALVVLGRLWAVSDPGSRAAVGGGMFNLVRRRALERSPGLAHLRLEVADDVALGQMLKRAGARPAIVHAVGFVTLDYYRTLGEMARGLEKNLFAVVSRFRLGPLVLFTVASLLLAFGHFVGLAHPSPWVRGLAGVSVVLCFVEQSLLARWTLRPLLPALAWPFGWLAVLAMAWRSAWWTLRRGAVVWRDTVYPIEVLRAGSRIELW